MPRTKGWSCCACQMGSAARRSSALKVTQQCVPVHQLVALEQARRPPDAALRHPAPQPRRDHLERALLEAAVRLGEEVEEADLVRGQPVSPGQRAAEAGAVL